MRTKELGGRSADGFSPPNNFVYLGQHIAQRYKTRPCSTILGRLRRFSLSLVVCAIPLRAFLVQ